MIYFKKKHDTVTVDSNSCIEKLNEIYILCLEYQMYNDLCKKILRKKAKPLHFIH